MADRRAAIEDWLVPAVLVGLALGLLVVIGIVLAVSAEPRSEAPALIKELDTYTACLVGHGADVPRVEVGRNGGFAVIVPGSLVDGEFDEAGWRRAADACADAAPDLFGAFLGTISLDWLEDFEGMDETIEAYALRRGADEDIARYEWSRPGPWVPPPDELRRRCDGLEEGGIGVHGLRGDRLRRLCEVLDR